MGAQNVNVLQRFRSARAISRYGSVIIRGGDRFRSVRAALRYHLPIKVQMMIVRPASLLRACFASFLPVYAVIIVQDRQGRVTFEVLSSFPEIEVLGITNSYVDRSVIAHLSEFRRLKIVSFGGSRLPASRISLLQLGSMYEEFNLEGVTYVDVPSE